jgi:hypothetical protein
MASEDTGSASSCPVVDQFERMPQEGYSDGFAKGKPSSSPMRVARAALGSLLQPGRGSRAAYATIGQDSDDELDELDELEGIDGSDHDSVESGGGEEEYWAMQRAGNCATFFNLCNTSLGIGILSFSLVQQRLPALACKC